MGEKLNELIREIEYQIELKEQEIQKYSTTAKKFQEEIDELKPILKLLKSLPNK